MLFSADGKVLIRYPQAKPGTEYVIPDGVTEIAIGAFAYVSLLEQIEIPKSVKTVGDGAFYKCHAMEKQ